jgi:hypothetical protein
LVLQVEKLLQAISYGGAAATEPFITESGGVPPHSPAVAGQATIGAQKNGHVLECGSVLPLFLRFHEDEPAQTFSKKRRCCDERL